MLFSVKNFKKLFVIFLTICMMQNCDYGYSKTQVPAKDITTSGFTGNCVGLTNSQACHNAFDSYTAPSYSFTNSIVNNAGTVTLANDSSLPGNSKYYGTDSSGTRGYFNLPSSAVWGSITGTLSNQTDLQNALNAKQNTITTGTTAQYFRGDLSLATFPTAVSAFTNDAGYITASSADNLTNKTGNISMWTNDSGYLTSADLSGYVPYTGATSNVDLGSNALITTTIKAHGSGGLLLESNSGTDVVLLGAGGGNNATFYGGVNIDGQTRIATSITGLVKAASGVLSAAVAGTDYVEPSDLSGYALLAGRSGGQTLNGGTASGEKLVLVSTSNATKGNIQLGNSYYDEVNNRLGIANSTPFAPITITGTTTANTRLGFAYSNTYGRTYFEAQFSSGSQNGNVFEGYINQIGGTGSRWIQVLGNQTVSFYNTVSTTASVRTGLGSVSSAAVSASTDANTGLTFTGGDQMNIVTGGVTRIEISNSTTRLQFGSIAVPGIGFTGDTDQGMYGGAGYLGISAGNYSTVLWTNATTTHNNTTTNIFNVNSVEKLRLGTTESVFNESGSNTDFRVEGDTDVNALFVDASADTVQVGSATTADSAKFYVSGKISTSGEMEINGALNHDGSTVGFYGTAPISQPSGNILTALSNLGLVASPTIPTEIMLAVSDETTSLTTGTGKITFRMPYAMTVTEVLASVSTAPTGSTIIVDINENGSTIMTTNKLSIDASEKTSTTAATAAGITDTALASDSEITIDIDQVGSTVAGVGLKVTIKGTK